MILQAAYYNFHGNQVLAQKYVILLRKALSVKTEHRVECSTSTEFGFLLLNHAQRLRYTAQFLFDQKQMSPLLFPFLHPNVAPT